MHTAAATGNTGTQPATGKTLTLGNVGIATDSVSGGFQLRDPSRGGGETLDAHNQTAQSTAGAVLIGTDNV